MKALRRMAVSLMGMLCLVTLSQPLRAEVQVATGASINEAQVTKTYYVDPAGADVNAGTQAAPFLTLTKALSVAITDKNNNIGVKVIVKDGVYRESLAIPSRSGGDTDAVLVLEAANVGRAIISASEASGWEPATWSYNAQTGNYEHALPQNMRWGLGGEWYVPIGNCANPRGPLLPELIRRRELFLINGIALQQVLNLNDLGPGKFYVQPEGVEKTINSCQGRTPITKTIIDQIGVGPVYFQPPAGVDVSTALIEAGLRDVALEIRARKNIVLRGLTFQHVSKSDFSQGAVDINRSSNILMEDCVVRLNNTDGMKSEGAAAPFIEDMTLRRSRFINNGRSGMTLRRARNVLIEDCETSYNNFRGLWADFISGWAPSGFKTQRTKITTWRRHKAIGNHATGMWWDSENADILVEDSFMSGNIFRGMFIENNQGPALARRNIITKTGTSDDDAPNSQAHALSISTSVDVTLENNIVYDNIAPQFGVWSRPERADTEDYITGEPYANTVRRLTMRYNVFFAKDDGQLVFDIPKNSRNAEPFDFFYDTLNSDNNLFWNPQRQDVFLTREFPTANSEPILAQTTLAGWQSFTNTEANSLFARPLFYDADTNDFRVQSDSPVRDWRLPIGPLQDVSGQVKVTRSGYRYVNATGRFVQTATLTNIGDRALQGQLSLMLGSLSSNAALSNKSGATSNVAPAGSPYIDAPAGDESLVPGASVTLTLEFTNPTKQSITYSPRVLAGNGSR